MDAYTAAARKNLTDFRERLLAIGIPFFEISQASEDRYNALLFWKLLEPVVSCPRDRPFLSVRGWQGWWQDQDHAMAQWAMCDILFGKSW